MFEHTLVSLTRRLHCLPVIYLDTCSLENEKSGLFLGQLLALRLQYRPVLGLVVSASEGGEQ